MGALLKVKGIGRVDAKVVLALLKRHQQFLVRSLTLPLCSETPQPLLSALIEALKPASQSSAPFLGLAILGTKTGAKTTPRDSRWQPPAPVNSCVGLTSSFQPTRRLAHTDPYYPNDPWGLEGPFLVVRDDDLRRLIQRLAAPFVQGLCKLPHYRSATGSGLWVQMNTQGPAVATRRQHGSFPLGSQELERRPDVLRGLRPSPDGNSTPNQDP